MSNLNEYSYGNFIKGNIEAISLYTQNKKNGTVTLVDESDGKWGSSASQLSYCGIVNGRENMVYDFIGGVRGEESYNFLIDLEFPELVERVVFACTDWEQILPTKLNIYIGNSKEEIFNLNAKAIKQYESKSDNGVYEANFDSKRVRFIRIEILDNDSDYYGEKIITVVRDISVFGDLNAPQDNFGKELIKKLKNTRNSPVTVMQPYLYKDNNGWTNSEWQSVEDYIDCEAYLGEGFTNVNIGPGKMINIGNTNNPKLISEQRELPDLSEYCELYFYVRPQNIGGKIKLQFVTGSHTSSSFTVELEPDKWTKINVKDFMNPKSCFSTVHEKKLRRIAISSVDINTQITVGSLLAVSKFDWSKMGIELTEAESFTEEKWNSMNISVDEIDRRINNENK